MKTKIIKSIHIRWAFAGISLLAIAENGCKDDSVNAYSVVGEWQSQVHT